MAPEGNVISPPDDRLKALLPSIVSGVTDGGHVGLNSAFLNKAREVEQGDQALAADLKLLAGAFSMYLAFFDGKSEFAPLAVFQGKRSMIAEDLTGEQLDRLQAVLVFSEEPIWVSRIADLLWLRRRNHLFARRAIQAYLECAKKPAYPWPERKEYLQRASHLAAALGKDSPERNEIGKILGTLFQDAKKNCFSQEWGNWPAALVKVIIEGRLTDDWETLGRECEEIARGFPAAMGCDEPRRYYELSAKCYRLAGEEEKAKSAELAIARHWESEYEGIAKKPDASGMLMAHRLEEAIKAYRRVEGQQGEVERLIPLLKKANTTALGQMKEITLPMPDLNPILQRVKKMMEARTGDKALKSFILLLHQPHSYDKIVEDVKRSAKEHPLQAIIGKSILASEGNQVAKVPGILEDEQGALRGAVVHQYNLGQGLAGATTLEQARQAIAKGTDDSWRRSIQELIAACPFVPEDRQSIYERGLFAGFEGDRITSVHILVPQLEDLLRRLFQAHGLNVTKVKQDGVQEERDLNDLLADPNAETLLGKDILWEMRSSLTEKTGWNLRNRVCHGLTDAEDFKASSANFLLWLTLFLILGLVGPSDPSSGY